MGQSHFLRIPSLPLCPHPFPLSRQPLYFSVCNNQQFAYPFYCRSRFANSLLKKWCPGKVRMEKTKLNLTAGTPLGLTSASTQFSRYPLSLFCVCAILTALSMQHEALVKYAADPKTYFRGPSIGGSIPQCSLGAGHIGVEQGGGGWAFKPGYLAESEHKQQKIGGEMFGRVKIGKYQPKVKTYQVQLYKKPNAKRSTRNTTISLDDAKQTFRPFLDDLKRRMLGSPEQQEAELLYNLPPREPRLPRGEQQ